MTTEPTNEALAELLPCATPWCDGSNGQPYTGYRRSDVWFARCPTCCCCTSYFPTEIEAIATWNTRLRSQPAPSSEETTEIQRLRDEVAEWKGRYNRKDGEYGRAIEAAYCCVRCGKPTPLAQARKEALEEAAGIIAGMARDKEADAEHDDIKKMQGASLAVAANALRSRAGEIG